MPRWLLRCLQALGMAWTLPNTVLGLLVGTFAMARGAHAHVRPRDLAIVFHGVKMGPGGAMTLGNVILHTGASLDEPCVTYAHRAGFGDEPPILLADHERAHVYQYMVLGALFLPLYLLCGGISVRNRFERAADRYALSGRGWWPWTAYSHPADQRSL
ncbi:MAG: hypothetical protein V4704_10010 [Pseudomonadota bacterium]